MEIALLFIGAVLGGVISWYISKFWTEKSSKEKPEWVDAELVKSIKEVLVKRPQDVDWTSRQIVSLYRQSLQGGSKSPRIGEIKHCAECGNEKITHKFFRYSGMKVYTLRCDECSWAFVDPREDIPEAELSAVRHRFEGYSGPADDRSGYFRMW